MKKKLTQLFLILAIGMMAFSCQSDDQQVTEPVLSEVELTLQEQAANEDAAFAELFAEIDALNAEYTTLNSDGRASYIEMPRWLRKTFNVVCGDVLGGVIGTVAFGASGPLAVFIGVITGVSSSITTAAALDEDGKLIHAKPIAYNATLNAYAGSINFDAFDGVGAGHNKVINDLYAKYGESAINSMTDRQLFDSIISQLVKNGYQIPPQFNRITVYSMTPQIQSIITTNNYDTYLTQLSLSQVGIKNQCNVIKSYLSAMYNMSESNCLKYHTDLRNTVNASNISAEAKEEIRLCISIGLASANFWQAEE